METKEITMRNQTTDSQLQSNFKTVMQYLTQVATERKYVITANGETVDHVEYLVPDLSKLTQTSRKKLAKRLFYASTTRSLGRINSFFNFLTHKCGTEKIKFTYGEQEKLIKESRAEFVKAKLAYEAALAKYKETKGDFYKS